MSILGGGDEVCVVGGGIDLGGCRMDQWIR